MTHVILKTITRTRTLKGGGFGLTLEKVDVITRMKTCRSITKLRRFLGACVFYQIWIPHFAHIAEPLYNLLRK